MSYAEDKNALSKACKKLRESCKGVDKMPIIVKCAYCGQMTKMSNCGFYRGVIMHNKLNCNCLQAAVKANFFIEPTKPERWERY
jgi:hypothetical protein